MHRSASNWSESLKNAEEFFEHALVSEMQLRLSAWAEQEPREGLQVHGILFGPAKAQRKRTFWDVEV